MSTKHSYFYTIVFSHFDSHNNKLNTFFYGGVGKNDLALMLIPGSKSIKLFEYQWQAQQILESLPEYQQLEATVIKVLID